MGHYNEVYSIYSFDFHSSAILYEHTSAFKYWIDFEMVS